MKVRALPIAHDPLSDGRRNPSITIGHEYVVLGIDDRCYRLIDDPGEPVLFEKSLFEVLDAAVPLEWVRREFEDGEYYIDPPECAKRGFYERWHDGDVEARRIVERVFRRLTETEGRCEASAHNSGHPLK